MLKTDFRRVLKSNKNKKPDIIFLDPPFSVVKYFTEALEIILKKELLSEGGIVVMEAPSKMELSILESFSIYKIKKIGDKNIYFLQSKYN